MDLSLDRIKKVADKLKLLPLNSFSIVIGGTNGKGSTVKFLENILINSHYKVGAYTSPHLLKFNERIRINNEEISDTKICEAFQHIEKKRGSIILTYFEYVTLAALILFKQAQLDFILLEVGLGGRLDAVNIIDADLALITNVALDHCRYLGGNREKIAFEKAGIIKQNKPICFGEKDIPEAITQKALELNAPLFHLGKNFNYAVNGNAFSWIYSNNKEVQLQQPKIHPSNAALVLQAVEIINKQYVIRPTTIEQAIRDSAMPGRLQYLSEPCPTLLDVAHNPHAVQNLAFYLKAKHSDKKIIAVFSALADKNLTGMLKIMRPMIKQWYIAELNLDRAADLATMQHIFAHLTMNNVKACTSIAEAYHLACETLQGGDADLIVVFGSFHTVAESIIISCT